MDLYYGDHGYCTCVMLAGYLMKRQKRGGGAFLPAEAKLLEIA